MPQSIDVAIIIPFGDAIFVKFADLLMKKLRRALESMIDSIARISDELLMRKQRRLVENKIDFSVRHPGEPKDTALTEF